MIHVAPSVPHALALLTRVVDGSSARAPSPVARPAVAGSWDLSLCLSAPIVNKVLLVG